MNCVNNHMPITEHDKTQKKKKTQNMIFTIFVTTKIALDMDTRSVKYFDLSQKFRDGSCLPLEL